MHRKSLTGFTTIELLAVIVVMSILAVAAIPRLEILPEFEKTGLHDKLSAGLQYARKTAISSRRAVCVATSNGNAGKVSLTIDATPPETSTGVCSLNLIPPIPDKTDGCAANQICAGSRLSITANVTSFQFGAFGRLSPASAVSFAVPGEANISIDAETGYVH